VISRILSVIAVLALIIMYSLLISWMSNHIIVFVVVILASVVINLFLTFKKKS
jgi:hypothetical protein